MKSGAMDPRRSWHETGLEMTSRAKTFLRKNWDKVATWAPTAIAAAYTFSNFTPWAAVPLTAGALLTSYMTVDAIKNPLITGDFWKDRPQTMMDDLFKRSRKFTVPMSLFGGVAITALLTLGSYCLHQFAGPGKVGASYNDVQAALGDKSEYAPGTHGQLTVGGNTHHYSVLTVENHYGQWGRDQKRGVKYFVPDMHHKTVVMIQYAADNGPRNFFNGHPSSDQAWVIRGKDFHPKGIVKTGNPCLP